MRTLSFNLLDSEGTEYYNGGNITLAGRRSE